MDKTDKLEACPFCGSEAHLRREPIDARRRPVQYEYFVSCAKSYSKDCPLFPRALTKRNTEIEAITDWNTRSRASVAAPPPDSANEATNKIADYFNAPPSVIPAIEQIIKRCWTSPVAATVDAETFAAQVVGTVFDNTAASHETLKATMIERIADAVRAPAILSKCLGSAAVLQLDKVSSRSLAPEIAKALNEDFGELYEDVDAATPTSTEDATGGGGRST